ncbi:DNA recombination protein RmuC [Campylobacter geochelonis]|uniref:RmuC family protein n=1 Tax=Campylobacter geochelonis TaxID=1780362 RepID=A0A128EP39_9BACT|nr:DNA recombination protein RmuC [Campylobacter geochelonis]QKF71518.1 DNA recombination protein [Campylobacter geochelonis]CZE47927.1 RmuC family protein [Campylobacter geochelonis]CZE48472.1 RmuC family protein [Campylobacter geochelonis]CZE50798.1 RmuC family protein [Campylobacter geochelonis]
MQSSYIFISLALFVAFVVLALFVMMIRQRDFFYQQILNMQNLLNEQSSKSQASISDINDAIIDRFFFLNQTLNESINSSNLNTTNNLSNGLNSLDTKFKNILEKINELENANESSKSLKDEVMRLNSIFSNQKLRGNFGEFELAKILELSYGENKSFYELQKRFDNNTIVDAVLKIKDGLVLPIDSKFPLANYQRICEACSLNDKKSVQIYEKEFKKDLKRQIDDISLKYILPPQTTEYAVMFIPSEAIFLYICSNLSEVFEYMNQKAVFMASPSTLMALLYSFKTFLRDESISKNANTIKQEIFNLSKDFDKFKEQNKSILNYSTKLKDATTVLNENSEKISSKFDKIKNLNF